MFFDSHPSLFYYHIANINTKIKFNKFFNNYFLVFFNFFLKQTIQLLKYQYIINF